MNKTCPECGSQIPLKAYICPFCKKPLKTKISALVLVSLLIFVLTISFLFIKNEDPKKYNDSSNTARRMAKDIVLSSLKAPATAKFCGDNVKKFEFAGAEAWEITGCIDAQNSYGAMLRNNYQVVLTELNGEWNIASIDIN